MGKLTYYIDYKEIATHYGVHISASKGLIGRPEKKEPESVEYAFEHGMRVDLSMPRFREREITLQCFVHASSRDSMADMVNAFMLDINKPGYHRLEVALDGRKSLFYEVYADGASYVSADWSSSLSIGTFTLKLIEPHPVKAVFRIQAEQGASADFSVNAESPINIHWGDGTCDMDVQNGTIRHVFERSAEFVVASGQVQGMSLNSADMDVITIHSQI